MATYNLYYYDTYRGDHHYKFTTAVDDDDDSFSCYGAFTIPKSDSGELRVFMVYTNDRDYSINVLHITSVQTIEHAKSILLELHSHINGCLPFNVTGMTSAYKEEGYYPDPVAVNNPNILRLDPDDFSKPTVALLVNDSGEIINHMSVCPCE